MTCKNFQESSANLNSPLVKVLDAHLGNTVRLQGTPLMTYTKCFRGNTFEAIHWLTMASSPEGNAADRWGR